MPDLRPRTVTRSQGNNQALKDGSVVREHGQSPARSPAPVTAFYSRCGVHLVSMFMSLAPRRVAARDAFEPVTILLARRFDIVGTDNLAHLVPSTGCLTKAQLLELL